MAANHNAEDADPATGGGGGGESQHGGRQSGHVLVKLSGQSAPLQRQISRRTEKQDAAVCCLQKPTLNIKTDRSKVKGHKKITHANTSQRKLSSYIKFEQSKLLTMNIAWV